MKVVRLLNQLIVMFAVVILVGACAKNAGVPGNNLAGITSDTNTGETTGGIDSSGGDTIKSSKEQVLTVLKDIKSNLIVATKRLSLSLSEYDVKDQHDIEFFKKEFNSDDMELMIRFILKNKVDFNQKEISKESRSINIQEIDFKNVKITINENEPCIGDNQHKAASAKGTIEDGEICLSIPKLMTVAPEALHSQVITLALHEVAHLYGFNEDEAIRIQKFLLNNMSTHSPSTETIHRIINNIDTLSRAVLSLGGSVIAFDSDIEVCNNIGNLYRSLSETIEIYASDKNVKLTRSWDKDLFVTYLEIKNAVRYCGINSKSYSKEEEKVEPLHKKNLAKSLNFIFLGINDYLMKATYYLDPQIKKTVPTLYIFAVSLLQYYGSEFSLSGQDNVQNPQYRVDASKNLACTVQNVRWSNTKIPLLQPWLQYKDNRGGSVYSYTNLRFADRDMRDIMVRQVQGNNALEIAVMEKEIKDAEIISGLGFLGGSDGINTETGIRTREVIPMGILYPGLADKLEIKYTSPKDNETYIIHCEVSIKPYNDLTQKNKTEEK